MAENQKLVSIIVPCYNARKVIDRCVSSLVRQSIGIDNIEIILVNDASTDTTLERLKFWEEQYPESVLLIDCAENGRTGTARNIGISYASADYIGFVDNDDYVDETMYEKMYRAITENDCDVVGVLYDRVDAQGNGLHFPMPKGKKGIRVDLEGTVDADVSALPGEIWSKLYRKSLIIDNEVYFPEKLCYPENYWGPLLRYYMKSYYVIDEVLYYYVMNEESIILSADNPATKDRLQVQTMLMEAIEQRGLDDIHSEKMEHNFVRMYYVHSLHLFFQHFQKLPYELFGQMKQEVLRRYPQYYNNALLQEDCVSNGAVLLLLMTVELKMTERLWDNLADLYKKDIMDLSVFLEAEKDDRVQGTVEPEGRCTLKNGYLLARETRVVLSRFYSMLSVQHKVDAVVWNTVKEGLFQLLEGCHRVNQAVVLKDGSCLRTYNEDVIRDMVEQIGVSVDLLCRGGDISGEKKDAVYEAVCNEISRLYLYMELPENLYRKAWGTFSFLPGELFVALSFCYEHAEEENLLEHARQMIFDGRSPLFAFPYEKTAYPVNYGFDEKEDMYYFIQDGVKLYLPKSKYSDEGDVEHYLLGLFVEQDERSPHRYLNERMAVPAGAVILDAGVAEGNFTASVIQKAQKVYLVECDPDWVHALRRSFRDYSDKIEIIEKYLSDHDDEEHITIDSIMNGQPLDYVKMDIEGDEPSALRGAKETLRISEHLKCNICVYHKLGDDQKVCDLLSEAGMDISHTPGYMFHGGDEEHLYYPRKGVVQAVK